MKSAAFGAWYVGCAITGVCRFGRAVQPSNNPMHCCCLGCGSRYLHILHQPTTPHDKVKLVLGVHNKEGIGDNGDHIRSSKGGASTFSGAKCLAQSCVDGKTRRRRGEG